MITAANEKFWMVFLMICPSFQLQGRRNAPASAYFTTDAPGMGCDEQNGLPVSMGKMQRQPVRQGLLTPQLPPQVAKPWAPSRSWRAETVPAHATIAIIVASNVFLITFLLTIRSPFQ
jgi:hypothetical protein